MPKARGDSFKHLQLKDKIMKLIGTLDSPYVRRVAISLNYYGIHFKHEPMSVFSNLERFKSINPVLKAPTLVLDDQTILLDSSLILDYFETEQQNKRKLMPETRQERSRSLRQIGLALAACEKTIQIVYERNLRPIEKQHEPWVSRVFGQLQAAFAELEKDIIEWPLNTTEDSIDQASITVAVAWSFNQKMLGDGTADIRYPFLTRHVSEIEQLTGFVTVPPEDQHNLEDAKQKRMRLERALFRS
jgi:glutathione S-transferase